MFGSSFDTEFTETQSAQRKFVKGFLCALCVSVRSVSNAVFFTG
jgi:hypothetical protein